MLEMVEYVTTEPKFSSNPARCFQLPLLACESLTTDVKMISDSILGSPDEEKQIAESQESHLPLLDKIVSFFIAPNPRLKPGSKHLNATLGGYLNRILTFWLMKRPDAFLAYIVKKRDLIQNLFNHLYLTKCVTDFLVRLCTVPEIQNESLKEGYKSMRTDIIQFCINSLDFYSENDFMTEQIFDILSSITKRCYVMTDPRDFFDEMMSPFMFLPLLEFTFEGGAHSRQGADFISLFFHNLFVAEPSEAKLDLIEANFGFNNSEPRDQLSNEKLKPEEVNSLKEISVVKEDAIRRQQFVSSKTRIYQKNELQQLIVQ